MVRDLAPGEAERFAARAAEAGESGFPDYYDEQRFGSLRGTDGEFIARSLLAGDYERALRLAVASPDARDRAAVRRRRSALRDRWGAWGELAEQLPESFERKLVEALAGGASFEEAYGSLDRELRRLHLSAFQAHLFNEGVRAALGPGPAWPGVEGEYRFPDELPEDESIPLAAADAEGHRLLDGALERAGVTRAQLEPLPFRAGRRSLLSFPRELRVEAPQPDELNAGRQCVALAFALRPGSYATMLVKRCGHDMRSGTKLA